jgi:hypothetical protein
MIEIVFRRALPSRPKESEAVAPIVILYKA